MFKKLITVLTHRHELSRSYLANLMIPKVFCHFFIHYTNIMFDNVLSLKIHDVLENRPATVMRCKMGKGSYSIGPIRRSP